MGYGAGTSVAACGHFPECCDPSRNPGSMVYVKILLKKKSSVAFITFHITKDSFILVDLRSVQRNEEQLYPDNISKSWNPKRMFNCDVVRKKDVARGRKKSLQ
jgi:predicted P-loop ATPase/GTPase